MRALYPIIIIRSESNNKTAKAATRNTYEGRRVEDVVIDGDRAVDGELEHVLSRLFGRHFDRFLLFSVCREDIKYLFAIGILKKIMNCIKESAPKRKKKLTT